MHRDEILEPSRNPASLEARKDAHRLFLTAKNLWHGENGFHQDKDGAIELFKLSARADYPPALYYLSEIYLYGEEQYRKEQAGKDLLRHAAKLGLSDAPARLAAYSINVIEAVPNVAVAVPSGNGGGVSATVNTGGVSAAVNAGGGQLMISDLSRAIGIGAVTVSPNQFAISGGDKIPSFSVVTRR